MRHADESYINVAVAIIRQEGKVLIARRAPKESYPGKWEFPGGKLEEKETPEEALTREVREELGMSVRVGERILMFEHDYGRPDHKKHRFFAFWCQVLEGEPSLTVHDEYVLVRVENLSQYDFVEADKQLVDVLLKTLRPLVE